MKVGIFGAGAIGGLLGARLAQSGIDVTFIARGPHLAAMQARGVELRDQTGSRMVRVRCLQNAADAGPQDYVIVALKAHSLPAAAESIAAMMGDNSTLVTAINGVPYWYFYGVDSPFRDRRIETVDPGGKLWDLLPPEGVIGCVVYPAAEVVEPGVIQHTYGDRFSLGEPDGTRTERMERFAGAVIGAGLKAPIRPRIRDEIWVKLWGNLAFNPISALTGSTLDRITTRSDLRALCGAMMAEAQVVAEQLGVRFAISLEKRINGASEVGVHKTSMLQDLERVRPLEIDALLGAVVELGEMTSHEMPVCRGVFGVDSGTSAAAGML